MKKFLLVIVVSLLLVNSSNAQADKRKKEFNLPKSSLAIEGYDPVAYFTSSKAIEGNKMISFLHEGVTYYFSTARNKELFRTNPSAYEPQYGGWCAFAMGSTGEKVEIDPETFKINNGKLYLFYNKYFTNTLKTWNKNEAALKVMADANWNKIYH